MCEASNMKFAPVYHQILQVYMYENVTYGPAHLPEYSRFQERKNSYMYSSLPDVLLFCSRLDTARSGQHHSHIRVPRYL